MPTGDLENATTTMLRAREMYELERRGSIVQIEMIQDEYSGSRRIRAHFGPLCAETELTRDELLHLHPQEHARIAAFSLSHRFARRLQEEIEREIYRAEAEYHRQLNYERAEIYGQNPAAGSLRHMRDLMRGAADKFILDSLPLKTWFNHKRFELNGWTAELLETDEQISAEGDMMQHCFARSYRNRIAKEEYLGYHITPPEGKGLPKSGFTLGFEVKKGKGFKYDQVKGKKNDTHHCKNPELLALIEHIDRTINDKPQRPKLDTVEIVNRAMGLIGA